MVEFEGNDTSFPRRMNFYWFTNRLNFDVEKVQLKEGRIALKNVFTFSFYFFLFFSEISDFFCFFQINLKRFETKFQVGEQNPNTTYLNTFNRSKNVILDANVGKIGSNFMKFFNFLGFFLTDFVLCCQYGQKFLLIGGACGMCSC